MSNLVLCACRRTCLALLLLIVGAGCSQNKTVSVKGTLLLDGNPVAGATITFLREGGGGRPASAVTNNNGEFKLTTFEPGDGALPGEYRIVVRKTEGLSAQPAAIIPGDAKSLKDHYRNRISREKKKPLLPAKYGEESKTPLRCTVPADGPVLLELKSAESG